MAYPKKELLLLTCCQGGNIHPVNAIASNGGEHFVFIIHPEASFIVCDSFHNNLTGKEYNTITEAQKAAEEVMYYQEFRGIFTD